VLSIKIECQKNVILEWRLDSSTSEQGPVTVCFEQNNKPLGLYKRQVNY